MAGTAIPITSRSIAWGVAPAGVDQVFQSTMNRDRILRQMSENAEMAAEFAEDVEAELEGETIEQMKRRAEAAERGEFGSPEALITHAVDVSSAIDTKRAAMAAHRSQIGPDSFFFKMPTEVFTAAFGTEWFIELDGTRAADAPFIGSILPG